MYKIITYLKKIVKSGVNENPKTRTNCRNLARIKMTYTAKKIFYVNNLEKGF